MRRSFPLLSGLLLLLPGLAFAGSPVVMDLTTGAPRELLDRTLGLAKSLFVLFFVASLVIEGLGKSPSSSKDYAGCVMRALIVFVLLSGYSRIFGSIVNLTEGIAARVTPAEVWTTFGQDHKEGLEKLYAQTSKKDAEAAASEAKSSLWQKADATLSGSLVGGVVFDSMIALLVLVSQALVWVMAFLSRVLGALFYVLGPLAIVASIPKVSGTGGRWFRAFMTLLCWPLCSGVLFSLTMAIGRQGMALQGVGPALGSVVSALLMAATTVFTPTLASGLVGGSTGIADQGLRMAYGRTTAMASSAIGATRRWAGERLRRAPEQDVGS